MVTVFGFGNLHILLIGWGMAYYRTYCDEHELLLPSTTSSPLNCTRSPRELLCSFVFGCWFLFMGLAGCYFFIVCIGGVLGRLILLDIRCSAHHLLSIGVCWLVVGGESVLLSHTTSRQVKGVTQIDGNYARFRWENGWKD